MEEPETAAGASAESEPDEAAGDIISDPPSLLGRFFSGLLATLLYVGLHVVVGALLAAATLWLAAPWGPMWTESGVVTEIDRSSGTAGGRATMNWLVSITSESGLEFTLDSPELSAYAEVGQEVIVERSSWTDAPMRARVEEGAFGRGGGFGFLFRVAGLIVVVGVVGLMALFIIALFSESFFAGLLSPVGLVAGAWLGAVWVIG